MITQQQIPVRANWERRIGTSGLPAEKWVEGQMCVMLPSYLTNFGEFLSNSCHHVFLGINEYFSKGSSRGIVDYPCISATELYNAMAVSWAHQDESLPIRLDVALMRDGSFRLLAVKADELSGVSQVMSANKSWFKHHYEGDPSVVELNYFAESFREVIGKYSGMFSGRKTVHGATIAVDSTDPESERTANDLQTYLREGCGLQGIQALDLEEVSSDELSGDLGMHAMVKVPSWKSVLSSSREGTFWPLIFQKGSGRMIMQPAWTYAVDNILADDLVNSPPDTSDVMKVVSAWVDIHGRYVLAGAIASDYFEDYSFEKAKLYPVVVITPSEE